MAATIKFKRGTTTPSTLNRGEPALQSDANVVKFYVGGGTDGSPAVKWVGAEIQNNVGSTWTSGGISDDKLVTQSSIWNYVEGRARTKVDPDVPVADFDYRLPYLNGSEGTTTATTIHVDNNATGIRYNPDSSTLKVDNITVEGDIKLNVNGTSRIVSANGGQLLRRRTNGPTEVGAQTELWNDVGLLITPSVVGSDLGSVYLYTGKYNTGIGAAEVWIGNEDTGSVNMANVVAMETIKIGGGANTTDTSDNGSVTFKLQSDHGDSTATHIYELPKTVGTVGQVLKIQSIPSSGTARLQWAADAAGTVDVAATTSANDASLNIQYLPFAADTTTNQTLYADKRSGANQGVVGGAVPLSYTPDTQVLSARRVALTQLDSYEYGTKVISFYADGSPIIGDGTVFLAPSIRSYSPTISLFATSPGAPNTGGRTVYIGAGSQETEESDAGGLYNATPVQADDSESQAGVVAERYTAIRRLSIGGQFETTNDTTGVVRKTTFVNSFDPTTGLQGHHYYVLPGKNLAVLGNRPTAGMALVVDSVTHTSVAATGDTPAHSKVETALKWADVSNASTVEVTEASDASPGTVIYPSMFTTSGTKADAKIDADGLEYRANINRFTIKGDQGGDLDWQNGGTSIGGNGGKLTGINGTSTGGSWGVGQLEFMAVDSNGDPTGATRFAVNAAQNDYVTYVIPEQAGSGGQVLRIANQSATTEAGGGSVYYLEWGAGANADLATDVAGGAAGDLLYQAANDDTTFLSIGGSGSVLTSSGSAPQWTSATANGQLLIGASGGSFAAATLTQGNYMIVTNGTNSISLNVDAATTNTGSKVVARDSSGNFSAGTITATALNSTSVTNTGAITISTTSGNADITLNPSGTGVVNVSTSRITNVVDPTSAQDAATKKYVDDVAQGLHIHSTVNAATTGTLASLAGVAVTFTNGVFTWSGGTAANAGGGFSDGVVLVAGVEGTGSRILVKDQATAAQNGIYYVSGARELTRATDGNAAADWAGGDFVFVTAGTLYNNTGWVQTETVTTLNTDAISFTQFSGAGTYTAANGIRLSGSQFRLSSDGSTDTSLTQGSLLYGNGSYVTSLAPSVNNNYVLTYNTSTNAPQWVAPSTITAGIASQVAVVNETTDTSCFLTFVTASTNGNYEIKTNSSIAYNSNTNSLDVTIDGGTY